MTGSTVTGPIGTAEHAFVVPAYGDSPYLEACLRSLTAQSAPSRIVVATSTPSPFIETRAKRAGAAYAVNPRVGGGIGADWNFALSCAERRFVTLAHQDDVYRPDFASLTLALFARKPRGALVFTGARHVDARGRAHLSRLSAVKGAITALATAGAEAAGPLRRRLLLAFGNPVHCSSVTLDTARLPDFRFDETLRSNLDWEAWLRLHRQGAVFLHAPEPLVDRRYHPGTETTQALRDGARAREDLQMFEALWPRPLARAIAFAYRAGY